MSVGDSVLRDFLNSGPAHELDSYTYILSLEIISEDPEVSKYKEFMDRYIRFLKILKNNYNCRTYEDLINSIQSGIPNEQFVIGLLGRDVVECTLRNFFKKGYPELYREFEHSSPKPI